MREFRKGENVNSVSFINNLNELVRTSKKIENLRVGNNLSLKNNNHKIKILGNRRNFGGGTTIFKAYAKAAAPASGTITCFLNTDTTGTEISVVCEVAGGTNLNAALPRLLDGTMITVWNDGGTWRSVITFQASGDC